MRLPEQNGQDEGPAYPRGDLNQAAARVPLKVGAMEHFVMEMLKVGAWVFGIVFLFAIVGVFAVISWIVNAIRGTERAVESGVRSVEDKLHR